MIPTLRQFFGRIATGRMIHIFAALLILFNAVIMPTLGARLGARKGKTAKTHVANYFSTGAHS